MALASRLEVARMNMPPALHDALSNLRRNAHLNPVDGVSLSHYHGDAGQTFLASVFCRQRVFLGGHPRCVASMIVVSHPIGDSAQMMLVVGPGAKPGPLLVHAVAETLGFSGLLEQDAVWETGDPQRGFAVHLVRILDS